MSHPPHLYLPLPNSNGLEDNEEPKQPVSHSHKHRRGRFLFLFAFGMSLTANIFALAFWLRCYKDGYVPYPQLTDNPAKSVLYYKPMVFARGGVDDASIYEQDPSPAVDAAWSELYEFSGSTLPGKEQIPSFNETLEFVKKKGSRIRMLDVFHQLHCLDMIRQALYPDHYHHPIDPSHVIHCVNSVRQSIMCMSDVSLVSWEWNQRLEFLIESAENVHTCRDFDRIKQWALGKHLDRQFVEVTPQ